MSPSRRVWTALVAVILTAFTAGLMAVLLDRGHPPVPVGQRVARHYLDHGLEDTGAVNIVSAVLLDYRGFDTLGEATVIFAAATVLTILMGGGGALARGWPMSPLVRCAMAYLLPFFWVFPVYIILQGHLSPGGGFQGGVALAVLLILAHGVYGSSPAASRLGLRGLGRVEGLGALAFLAVGLVGLLGGSGYLANLRAGFTPGTPGEVASAGAIPLLNAVIGLKVAAALGAMFHLLARERIPPP